MKLIFLIEGSAFLPRRSVSILSSTYAKNSVLLMVRLVKSCWSIFVSKIMQFLLFNTLCLFC